MKLTRRDLTALGAVVVVVGLGAFFVLEVLFRDQLTPARATDMLRKTSPALVEVLRSEFAPDFSRIVKATLENESRLTGENDIARFLDHQTRPITENLGEVGRRAPTPLLTAWLEKLAASMDLVQSVAGAEICSRLVNEGPSILTDPAMREKLEPGFDARDAAFFAALAGARDAPESNAVGQMTDDDWKAIATAMGGLEVPAGYGMIVANDLTTSPDYCPALAYYYRTIAALPGESGDRIRAEYFVRSFS